MFLSVFCLVSLYFETWQIFLGIYFVLLRVMGNTGRSAINIAFF